MAGQYSNSGFSNNGSLPKNPFGDPNSGVVGGISNSLYGGGQSQAQSQSNPPVGGTGYTNGQAVSSTVTPGSQQINPVKGLLDQYQPQAPVKKLVSSTGDEVHFDNTGGQTGTPSEPTPAPGTSFQGNLGNIGTQSQYGNPQEQAINDSLLNAGLYYGNKGSAPLGGFNIGGAAQGFQQAQQGLLQSQVAAAQPALADIQAQRQSRLGGAETQAGLTAPQPYGITSTPYSPGSNTFGTLPGGEQGAVGAGIVNSQIQAGQNLGQSAQAIGKAQPVAKNLDNLINTNGINPTDLTYANGAINFLKANAGSPQQQAAMTEFNGQLNDLASTLAPVLGIPGGATTDFKTQLGQSIVNGLQNGQSIEQSIQYFISQAQQGAVGAAQGAENPYQTLGIYNF